MNNRPFSSLSSPLRWGAVKIAGLYLLIGSLWILFSDRLAERIALNKEMLASLSLYKGWAYVIVTAFLLYWLIQRDTGRLHASEKQLQVVINALPVLISYVDKNRHYQFTNEAYEEWFGEKAQGKRIEELIGEATYQKISKYVDKALNGETVFYETEIPYQDGGERFVSATYIPDIQTDGQVRGFFALVQDISEQKESKEKLRQWADAFEGCAHGIAISDPNTNRVVVCNPAFANMFKCRVEDIVGSSILSLYAPSDHEHVRGNIERADQIGRVRYEAQMTRRDRSLFPVQMDVVSVLGEDGELLYRVATAQDISERKQAEEGLHRFELLSEHSRDIILFMRRNNGQILEANAAAIQAYRYSRQELLALTIGDLRARDTHSLTADQMAQADAGGILFETIHLRKDGTTFPVEVSSQGANIGGERILISVVRDITERKGTEEDLRRNEERYRYLFENNPYPMWIYDRKTLVFLDVNEAAITKYGYSRQEFLNMTIVNIRPPEDVERLISNLAQPRQPLEQSDGWRHRLKDGKIIHVEVTSHTIEIDGHESALVIAQDVTERVQAQNAVRTKDELLRLTSEMAKVGGWEFDTPTLKGTWTDEVARIHDLDPSQESNVEIGLSFYIGESRAKIEKAVKEAIELAQPYDLELEMVSAKGNLKWVRTAALPIMNNGKVVKVQGIFQDITERKRAEEALRENEQKFSIIYYKAPFAAALSKLPDGVIVDVNEAFERVFGYTKQEVVGKTSLELGINPDSERRTRLAAELQTRGSVRDMELMLLTKSGATRVFLMNIDLVGIGGQKYIFQTAQDITERKQAEEALQKAHDELEIKVQERTAALSQANTLLQALMDTMPDQIYFKDIQSRFIRNSRSQASLLGLSDPTEAIGKTDFDFFSHASKAYAEEQEVMRSGRPLIDFEEWVVWPDGRESWVSTTKVPLRNSDGETIGIFGISRDITERKGAEQAIRELNTDLENQAAKLQIANKELEAFSYSVSHDLRAPLRAIDGYTRILVEDYETILDAEGKRVCSIISAEARRMGQLIDDLLAFSRLGRKEMYSSNIDMKALVISVLNELIKEGDRERINFKIARLPSARADSSLMRQVWVNLLSNALKFTSKKERAVIEVGSKSGTEEVTYYVRDSGAGFDMEYANKLFGVFQRLHSESEFEGTGVGLAIVQRIIRRHDGRVWAEGEIDKGATFYFALPRKEKHHE
jgi:PAS domain S-box